MASFVKFYAFSEDLANAEHDLFGTDHVLKFYLTNTTPDVAADAVKADLAEIATGNGYTGPIDIENNGTRSSGTVSIAVVDKQIEASGGAVAEFQWAVVYNDTHASDALIGYYDYGGKINLQAGETFDLDFSGDVLLTVA
jgi:hypothetical protein